MKKRVLFTALVLLIAAGTSGWWMLNHHVVQTRKGVVVLPKRYLSLQDTFTDTRTWQAPQFKAHPAVREALVRGGYGDLLRSQWREDLDLRYRELAEQADLTLARMKVAAMAGWSRWLDDTYDFYFARN